MPRSRRTGTEKRIIRSIAGGVACSLRLHNNWKKVFEEMLVAHRQLAMMSCISAGTDGQGTLANGLAPWHAYFITSVKQFYIDGTSRVRLWSIAIKNIPAKFLTRSNFLSLGGLEKKFLHFGILKMALEISPERWKRAYFNGKHAP